MCCYPSLFSPSARSPASLSKAMMRADVIHVHACQVRMVPQEDRVRGHHGLTYHLVVSAMASTPVWPPPLLAFAVAWAWHEGKLSTQSPMFPHYFVQLKILPNDNPLSTLKALTVSNSLIPLSKHRSLTLLNFYFVHLYIHIHRQFNHFNHDSKIYSHSPLAYTGHQPPTSHPWASTQSDS
jgi:hypothetical protein